MKKRKADILFLIMFIHQKYLITKDLRGIIQKLVLMFCIIKIRKKKYSAFVSKDNSCHKYCSKLTIRIIYRNNIKK